MKKSYIIVLFFFLKSIGIAQFAPPAGQPGSTAIYKDSSIFVRWATNCTVVRGFQDISNPSLGYVSTGDSSMVLGIAGSNGVVSLGDGGYAIVSFAYPLRDAQGWDFAVFENSFSDSFLELAFVEVSSDGINFFRFPCTSNTQDTIQIDNFGAVDATKIDNLAGKYKAFYGTPFDLQQLANQPGLNINAITKIKIIDVVGCIQSGYASLDQYDHPINDPWRTPFPQGGFDLDAVGVIHDANSGITDDLENNKVEIYPNPATKNLMIRLNSPDNKTTKILIKDISGKIVQSIEHIDNSNNTGILVSLNDLSSGIYFINIISEHFSTTKKLIISSN